MRAGVPVPPEHGQAVPIALLGIASRLAIQDMGQRNWRPMAAVLVG